MGRIESPATATAVIGKRTAAHRAIRPYGIHAPAPRDLRLPVITLPV